MLQKWITFVGFLGTFMAIAQIVLVVFVVWFSVSWFSSLESPEEAGVYVGEFVKGIEKGMTE